MPMIHHPRILLALLLVIGLIGGTVAILANQQDSDGRPVPLPIPTPGPLVEADKQAAVDIVRQSGVVERIADNQSWSASDFYRRPVGQGRIYFIATWEQPVEYAGPWLDGDNCQGTRAIEFSSTWTGITQLNIIVHVENAEVVHYTPHEPGRVNPSQEAPQRPNPKRASGLDPEDPVTVYDLESQRVIYEGPMKDAPQECPPGKESD